MANSTPAFELRSRDGGAFRLVGEVIRLGRASDNMIVVNDPAVSRYHINFYVKDGGLIAEDAGSANGFAVNGQICKTSIRLSLGDRLVIGSKEYRVETPGAPIGPPPMMAPQAGAAAMAPPAGVGANSRMGGAAANVGGIAGMMAPKARIRPQRSNVPLILGGVVIALAVLVFAREGEKKTDRAPASVNEPLKATPLPTEAYGKDKNFTPRSTSEIKAEARYRESLRDYYNGNYSRAMIGFKDALTMMPSHEGANEYLQQAETALQDQLKELLEDGQRSMTVLQYHRAKGQSMRILTIISEQVPQYSRKVASDVYATGVEKQIPAQEQILLDVPCDTAKKYIEVCKQAIELLKQSRKFLGDEDTLR